MFCRKGVLKNLAKFTGIHLCQSLFIKKETLVQVFSCEFCEISKRSFSTEHLRTTVFVVSVLLLKQKLSQCLNFFSFFCLYFEYFISIRRYIEQTSLWNFEKSSHLVRWFLEQLKIKDILRDQFSKRYSEFSKDLIKSQS